MFQISRFRTDFNGTERLSFFDPKRDLDAIELNQLTSIRDFKINIPICIATL